MTQYIIPAESQENSYTLGKLCGNYQVKHNSCSSVFQASKGKKGKKKAVLAGSGKSAKKDDFDDFGYGGDEFDDFMWQRLFILGQILLFSSMSRYPVMPALLLKVIYGTFLKTIGIYSR